MNTHPDAHNPIRLFAQKLGALLLFIRVSNFQQTLTFFLGTNFSILYLVGFPAILGAVLGGGLVRVSSARGGRWWIAFTLWMAAVIPFSSWIGGSFSSMLNYYRTNVVLLLIAGGLPVTWNESQKMVRALFWGAVGTVLASKVFQGNFSGDRMGLEFGSIANPNDFAAHLLFCLPFLYLGIISSKSKALRGAALIVLCYGLYVLLGTGSRGGLLGLIVAVVCTFVWGSRSQRIVMLVAIPALLISVVSFVPESALNRIVSFSKEDPAANEEALASSAQRKYVLDKSIEYTLGHPIFGVGPFLFPTYEGTHNTTYGGGVRGAYLQTHNAYTQVSSECGIPGLILYLGGMIAAFRILYKVNREARRRPDCKDIQHTTTCVMTSMAAFSTAIFFLSLAYAMYQPIFVGLALTVGSCSKAELQNRATRPEWTTPA